MVRLHTFKTAFPPSESDDNNKDVKEDSDIPNRFSVSYSTIIFFILFSFLYL